MRTYAPTAGPAALLATLLFAGLPPASAQDNATEIARLHEEIRELDQKLRILSRQQELKEEAATAGSSRNAVVSAGAGGFSIGTSDRDYLLRLRANVQADGRFYLSDGADDTFLLRRVRPIVDITLAKDFSARIMPDFAGSSPTLVDAYATYSFSPQLNIQAGKFKAPFDIERLVSQTDLLFVERSYTTSLAPNRDVGIQVFGEIANGVLSYNLGWTDGTTDAGTAITDNDDNKEWIGRLFAEPFKNSDSPLQGLGFGVAFTHGDKDGGAPAGYRTNAQQTFFSWASGVTNTGTHTRIEPQAYYYSGPFGLIGAWASSKQDVTAGVNSAELENTGWFVAANYVLTGEKTGFRAVTPAKNFNPAEGTWGAWEIAVRFAELDIDDDAFPLFANPATSATKVSSTTVGVNWYLNRNVKLVLNWEHSSFDGGAAGAVTGQNEDAILTRAQLRF